VFEQYMLMPISLQVLAENAVKHNEFSVREPMEIRIWLEGSKLVVHNRVARKEIVRGSPGVGLANLDERCRVAMGVPLEVVETADTFAVYLPILPVE
jgi:sensor histidine kinase YesM